jgi:purine-nucleoside phosphorylase
LGNVAERLAGPTIIANAAIPHLPRPTVAGHAGRLILGTLAGVPVAALQGRIHLYEGYTPRQVIFSLRVLRLLGAEILIVTAAAGGLDPALAPGELLLLRDHLGLPTLSGANPLVGPNDERFGPRFPALDAAYDEDLRTLALAAARKRGIMLREGVYAMVAGPSYETPAESRMLRVLGADAVGMSTVPEVIAARHLGMRVLGFCVITNAAPPDGATAGAPSTIPTEATDHVAVLAVAERAGQTLGTVLEDVLAQL